MILMLDEDVHPAHRLAQLRVVAKRSRIEMRSQAFARGSRVVDRDRPVSGDRGCSSHGNQG